MRVDQITEARVYGNGGFVKSLTQEETLENGEDSEWEETEEALQSDEELEDGDKSCGIARSNKKEMFQRVTSKPNLRSLLTTLLHENGRATALQNAAPRSALAIHRHRTPNGPVGSSPRKKRSSGVSTAVHYDCLQYSSSSTVPSQYPNQHDFNGADRVYTKGTSPGTGDPKFDVQCRQA